MKKPLLIVIIILAAIFILPVINFLRWNFQPKKPLGIVIVDKTVPSIEREKHKSLNWILTNDRFVKKEKKTSYSYQKDYFGFFPTRPLKEKKWRDGGYRLTTIMEDLSKNYDAVYLTDTYGVFFNDWFQGVSTSRRSRRLYGGLNSNDNVLIKEMKDQNKLVILEYNSFDYPTAEFESYRIQERLGVKYQGWTGKYFSTLDSSSQDMPLWIPSMYRKQYKKAWNFSKPGVVLVRDKAMIVLEEGTHLSQSMPVIVTDSLFRAKYSLPETMPFDQWFDIIDPMENYVPASFKLETTALADSVLLEYGLDNVFPAIVVEPTMQRTYYFSGDFTYANIPVWTSRLKGVEKIKGLLYSNKPEDPRRFFWLYYKPLIKGILNEYYEAIKE